MHVNNDNQRLREEHSVLYSKNYNIKVDYDTKNKLREKNLIINKSC